jgi:hypothetical protein
MEWFSGEDEPWKSLRVQNERIGRGFDKQKPQKFDAREEGKRITVYDSMSLAEILDCEDQDEARHRRKIVRERAKPSDIPLFLKNLDINRPWVTLLALIGLAKVADITALDTLVSFIKGNSEMPGFLHAATGHALNAMPSDPLLLDLGRGWFDKTEWHLRQFGEEILKHRATHEDLPRLRNAISKALQNQEEFTYRLCSCVDALKRFPNLGRIEELEAVFSETIYSYARIRAASAAGTTCAVSAASAANGMSASELTNVLRVISIGMCDSLPA